MTFSERIISIIKEKSDGSKAEFARKIGIHVSTISLWDDDHLPNGNILRRIQKEFDVNLNWIVGDQGEPYMDREGDISYQTEDAVPYILDTPEGGVEDKDGNWGDTRRHEKEGVPFDVSLFKPKGGFDSYRDAQEGLREIYKSRDTALIRAIESNIRAFRLSARLERQVTQQAREIEDLKKRISTLEEKHKPEDPHKHDHESKRSTAT